MVFPGTLHNTGYRNFVLGILVGFSVSLTSTVLLNSYNDRRRNKTVQDYPARPIEIRSDEIVDGVVGLIGMGLHFIPDVLLTNAPCRKHPSCANKISERCTWCRDTRESGSMLIIAIH